MKYTYRYDKVLAPRTPECWAHYLEDKMYGRVPVSMDFIDWCGVHDVSDDMYATSSILGENRAWRKQGKFNVETKHYNGLRD